jgi:hypothetical protein
MNRDAVVIEEDILIPSSMHRIELKQMRMTSGIALDLIDMDELQFVAPPPGAQAQFAHAAEAIDTNPNSHAIPSY